MNERQRFAHFQLFKRLASGPFGETYRAGRVGPEGIDRVVLINLLTVQDFDADAFSAAIESRASLGSILRSPNLGQGLEMGVAEGIPYVAYDHVSGRSLAQLLEQSRERPFPIPTEHALFIAERVALGLSAAHQTRFGGEPLVHGFLTPDWIWLSSEGEIRVLGVEISPGLRLLPPEALADGRAAPYLSPETRHGAAVAAADDVYSLGALLFALLTGQAPPAAVDDPQSLLDGATLAADGEPVPESLRQLLAKSLGPQAARPAEPESWRLELAQLVDGGDYSPTTFNLAFFLHTLFRGEIERDSVELESERDGTAAVLPAEGPGEAEPVEAGGPEPAAPEESDSAVTAPPVRLAGVGRAAPEGRGRRIALLAGAAALAALVAAAAVYFTVLRPDAGDAPGASAATGTASPNPDAAAAGDPLAAGGLPETESLDGTAGSPLGTETEPADVESAETAELEAQVRELIADRTGELESSLKAEYEQRLAALQRQLDQAREAAAKREAERLAAAESAETKPPPPAEPEKPRQAAGGGATPGGSTPPAGGAGTAIGGTAAAPPATAAAPATAEVTGADATAAGAPAPVDEPVVVPEPREVRPGDLVTPGAGVLPPRIERQANPIYPPAALRFRKQATVKLRVLVDERGRAERIEQVSEDTRFGFDAAAVRAAEATRWKPATKDGVPVKMWVDLTIEFRP